VQFATASYRTWRPGAGSPVVASLTTPRWRPEAASWPRCWALCPRWAWFHAPADEFDRQYLAQLERYGVERIHAELARIAAEAYEAPSERLVLCCFEPPEAAETGCHRRTFAAWWMRETGEKIPELTG
jgi:hypothetical protein